jgi:hypothetical protein
LLFLISTAIMRKHPSQKHEETFFLETLKLLLIHIQTLKLKNCYTTLLTLNLCSWITKMSILGTKDWI